MTSSQYKALLFDLDGTIINTTEFVYQAFEHTLNEHGHDPIDRAELSKLMGLPLHDTYQRITTLKEIHHLFQTHDEFQQKNLQLAVPFPNTIETIQKIREKGIKTAVVTTRGRRSALQTLEQNDMIALFDTIIAFDDVTAPKPDAEPVLKALANLQVYPENAMMIGDTDLDVGAGKNAGVTTVAVAYGFQGETVKELKPDFIINSIEELLPIIE